MEVRSIQKHKETSALLLGKQQDKLLDVYEMKGVSYIDTRNLDSSQVTKKIAEVIFRNDYFEVDMHKWLTEAKSSKG